MGVCVLCVWMYIEVEVVMVMMMVVTSISSISTHEARQETKRFPGGKGGGTNKTVPAISVATLRDGRKGAPPH